MLNFVGLKIRVQNCYHHNIMYIYTHVKLDLCLRCIFYACYIYKLYQYTDI
jgi:hypothetical protein